MKLCEKGYYNGTIFHRSIRNFMARYFFIYFGFFVSKFSISLLISDRFKEEILLEKERAASRYGRNRLKTNSSQI